MLYYTYIACLASSKHTSKGEVHTITTHEDTFLNLGPGHSTPSNDPVPIVLEAAWTPRPVWTGVESPDQRYLVVPDRLSASPQHSRLSCYNLQYKYVFNIDYIDTSFLHAPSPVTLLIWCDKLHESFLAQNAISPHAQFQPLHQYKHFNVKGLVWCCKTAANHRVHWPHTGQW